MARFFLAIFVCFCLKNLYIKSMEFEKTLQADLVSAMKGHQENAIAALRSVKAAIQNEKVNGAYHELTDNDIVKLIQKLVKQRKESIDIYSQAGRNSTSPESRYTPPHSSALSSCSY